MKIIILGAGKIGRIIAESLIDENNDITVIDVNEEKLHQLQDKLDLRVINGFASYPKVLREARAEETDVLIAVTGSDEVNMIACQVAHSFFKIPNKIARVRSQEYTAEVNLFSKTGIPVDYFIYPEKLIIDSVRRLIQYPGALQIVNFYNRIASSITITVQKKSPLLCLSVFDVQKRFDHLKCKVISIFRENYPIFPKESTIIQENDEICFVVKTENIRFLMNELQVLEKPYKKIMIVGGGKIGSGLAKILENIYDVKIIEKDPIRASQLSAILDNTTVLYGYASDKELLFKENISQIDAFITLTENDEVNIMYAMLAKKMGAKRTIVLIHHGSYLDLRYDMIDNIIFPKQTILSNLLGYIRKIRSNISYLRRGTLETFEIKLNRKSKHSGIVGKRVVEIDLDEGIMIGAIIRNNDVIVSLSEQKIKLYDILVIFTTNKKHISEINRTFK
ncbi:Trk system potassium transporter TrkA [Candidatus Riesia pediculischaeffi]|uniref:Trk system potassium uptake protein TrkA n=1 Tax=Candidatus Riesia pediculischaeffi PTSU TaxID=1401651 RepID=A0A0C1VJT1_9ENTR|nr:Trk system potassium transporter TrkA [Candidatus Riesia pediculischaeffi]KIE64120.1 Trk system potassium uptake protein TrkA [Candidatus Riesia pediculischaeffi PTSU]